MSDLMERIPTASRTIRTESAGPTPTRPFGLDALTNARPVDLSRGPALSVDPESQLSLTDGRVCLDDTIRMQDTICNTESDGQDAIAIDEDQNDD